MLDYNAGAALSESLAAINTAISTLQRLGKADAADALIDDATQTNVYAAIDADRDHNDDWKRTQYALIYTRVISTLARKLTAAAGTAGTQDQDDAARVYGIKGLPGDVASLAISRRDAGDRVGEVSDFVTLQRLLDTASRNGDEVLAHAIAETAIKSGDSDTTNAFAAAYPNLKDAVERLWTSERRRMTTLDVKVALRVAALKPAALAALQDYEIAAAADGQTNAGSWNA